MQAKLCLVVRIDQNCNILEVEPCYFMLELIYSTLFVTFRIDQLDSAPEQVVDRLRIFQICTALRDKDLSQQKQLFFWQHNHLIRLLDSFWLNLSKSNSKCLRQAELELVPQFDSAELSCVRRSL